MVHTLVCTNYCRTSYWELFAVVSRMENCIRVGKFECTFAIVLFGYYGDYVYNVENACQFIAMEIVNQSL